MPEASLSWDRTNMNIQATRLSIKQLKRNIAKLKKKPIQSEKTIKAIEKSERKLSKKIAALDAVGVSIKAEPKARKKKQNKFGAGDYTKYINSPEWAARKAAYYECHHRRCRSCGSDEKEMHLHHRSYARIYQEEDGDLMPMCMDCHAMLHLFQKSFGLPVEDATSMWLSVTNGTSNKRKIREALRSVSFDQFRNLWRKRSKSNLLPAHILGGVVERIAKGDLGSREDVLSDRASFDKEIAFSKRTGIMEDYDAKVDAIIRRLERS